MGNKCINIRQHLRKPSGNPILVCAQIHNAALSHGSYSLGAMWVAWGVPVSPPFSFTACLVKAHMALRGLQPGFRAISLRDPGSCFCNGHHKSPLINFWAGEINPVTSERALTVQCNGVSSVLPEGMMIEVPQGMMISTKCKQGRQNLRTLHPKPHHLNLIDLMDIGK